MSIEIIDGEIIDWESEKMIPLKNLKIGCMYEGRMKTPDKWDSSRRQAIYKGEGQFWTAEYDMLPNGDSDYRSKSLRIRQYGITNLQTFEPKKEIGMVHWENDEQLKDWIDDPYVEPRVERGNMLSVEIDPRWRTSTVIDMCRSLLESEEWHRLPILGDALMDAGCDSQELITACQSTKESAFAMRIAAIVLGGEHADAIKWLEQFADKYNFSWIEMIHAATVEGSYVVAMGHDLHGPSELDDGEEDQFWQCIQTLTGKGRQEENIWSCSC